MFGIGGMELVVIFLIALLVLGPERLPEVAKIVAKVVRELRRAGDEVRMHLDPDLNMYGDIHRDPLPPKNVTDKPEGEAPETAAPNPEIGDGNQPPGDNPRDKIPPT